MDDVRPEAGDTAALIDDGDVQTVRLPEGYRLDAKEVRIRRDGDALVLEPVKREADDGARQRYWDEIFANLGEPFDDDMVAAALDRPKDFGQGRRDEDIESL